MNSMFSIVMVFALLLGNVATTPTALLQIRSGELKFRIETKLNKPLNEKLAEEMGGTQLDNLSCEFDIKYKMSEDLKKIEMQCDMLAAIEQDKQLQISYWINQDLSDKNIPKSLIIVKQKDEDKYHVINIQTPVVHKGMTIAGLFGGLFNAETINSLGKSVADSFKESGAKMTEKEGGYTAVLDENTVKKMFRNIALEMSGYLVPIFGMSMMAHTDTRIVINNNINAFNIRKEADETAKQYSQRIIDEMQKIDGESAATCDFYTLKDEAYVKYASVKISGDNSINQIYKIVEDNDEGELLTRITFPAPEMSSNVKITSQEEIRSQISAPINGFFDKLNGVKLFDKDALVLNMTLDNKNQPKNINYSIHINTNAVELAEAFDGSVDNELAKKDANIDMTISLDYAYSKVNEEITIDYPNLTAENSIDLMQENSLPDIDVNAVNIVCNNNLTQLNNKPFINDGVVYLPLREVLNLKGITDENIIWDNGIIKIKTTDLTATLKVDSDEVNRNNQKINVWSKVLLQGDSTYIPVAILGELGIGDVTNTFFDDDNKIIGCVISINRYVSRETQALRVFISSDADPMWEKYLYQAGDMAGLNIDVGINSVDSYLERTNLIIAAGDPMVLIGKYDEEFINQMTEMNAIYPVVKVNDEYSIIIPKVIKNMDTVSEVIKNFTGLINQ